ncbi:MAG: glutamate 5-kinase [Endomicrobiales bacterium]|nr:glutamate 5-kinase [Endomicrobiales bacterium]
MRIVIKLGSNLLTTKDGSLDKDRIKSLVTDIAKIKKADNEVVIVSSGAIAAGMGKMKKSSRPSSLKEKQALAAVGQPLLMDVYQDSFNNLDITIAQLLLTRNDFDDRQRYLNARNTLLSLLDMGVVPIINENDTVSVEEINFGDNDTLASIIAAKICAEYLILLTDVDGLYKGVPGKSEVISDVGKITKELEQYASKTSGSGKGTGGMQSKVSAAKAASSAGVKTVIANGLVKGIIGKIISGEKVGTTFNSQESMGARKCWIAFGSKCKGEIVIDAGAVNALRDKKKSLLPSGIVSVNGRFEVGDMVSVLGSSGEEVGRGLSYYSSDEINKIKGKKTVEIKKILGKSDFDEVIHRDNLVILS